MKAPVYARSMRDRRRSLAWWSLGTAAYLVMMIAVYPTVRDSSGIAQAVQDYPEAMMKLFGVERLDMTSGAGYLSAELYGFVLPLLVMVLAIGAGAALIAGAQERGTLDLVLAHPVRRRALYLQDAAVVASGVGVVSVLSFVVVAVADPLVTLNLSLANLALTTLGLFLLGVLVGWVALAVGAATGSHGLAVGVAGGFAAGSYLLMVVSGLVGALEGTHYLSAYWYAVGASPLSSGMSWWRPLALLGLLAVVLAAGVWRFEGRDLAA